ncbi:MAG: hypothetical protein U1A77_17025 [Pirellulales bacterium]
MRYLSLFSNRVRQLAADGVLRDTRSRHGSLTRGAALLTVLTGLMLASDAVAQSQPQVTKLKARHAAGQTILTFTEASPLVQEESLKATAINELRQSERAKRIRYRVYHSSRPIVTLNQLQPVMELPPLTGWNTDYFGEVKPGQLALRYVSQDGGVPVGPTTGIGAYNPPRAGFGFYAVTAVVDGVENKRLGPGNSLASPVKEVVGLGEPVLQRIETPAEFQYVKRPKLHYFVRWESPPNCAVQGKPFDYLVAVPENVQNPAPVGIHFHCWGGSLNEGYGWWYQGEQGHMLMASNQAPYDWWTGYHERLFDGPADETTWRNGVVRPYTQRRLLSFFDWMRTRWPIDAARTHVAGTSMGGSGGPSFAIRNADRVAWTVSWVGVHRPRFAPGFVSSYEQVYGKLAWDVKFEDGTPVWDHFDDVAYLRKHPELDVGFITFSNGKNDDGIGWKQAVDFLRALQETRRPHLFVWGQQGHGQRAALPVTLSERHMMMDLRLDQSQPAFTRCSLDDLPGDGDPKQGAPEGQCNLYLTWVTEDVVDTKERWEMTVRLIPQAPRDACTVDLTPRRTQQFKLAPGTKVRWQNRTVGASPKVGSGPVSGKNANGSSASARSDSGIVEVDRLGLITIPKLNVTKAGNRISLEFNP